MGHEPLSADRTAPAVSRDELVALMPLVIRQVLPVVPWDIGRLHVLELPVRPVPVGELAWLLDLSLWQLNGIRFQVSAAQVRADPDGFPDHMRRVMAADHAHPIHLVEHGGRLVVLDGYHRLLKAVILGRARIDAMVLSQQHFASICAREAPEPGNERLDGLRLTAWRSARSWPWRPCW